MILCTSLLTRYKTPLITAGLILALFLFLFLLKKYVKYCGKKKEIALAAADRVRDENLNNIILNSSADGKNTREVYKPYDVDYGSQDKTGREKGSRTDIPGGKQSQLMIQLIEKTELSTRKFVLNPAKIIRIGSDLQDNDISVLAEGISPHQCEIFAAGGRVYIRNTGEGARTVIRRKKQQAIVDNKGIRLLTGDRVLLGNIYYDITITGS